MYLFCPHDIDVYAVATLLSTPVKSNAIKSDQTPSEMYSFHYLLVIEVFVMFCLSHTDVRKKNIRDPPTMTPVINV